MIDTFTLTMEGTDEDGIPYKRVIENVLNGSHVTHGGNIVEVKNEDSSITTFQDIYFNISGLYIAQRTRQVNTEKHD